MVATVSRAVENEFGEPGDTPLIVGTFPCLFHVEKSYVTQIVSDATYGRGTTNSQIGTPMVMCLMESVVGLDLQIGDEIVLSSDEEVTYELVELNDVQSWGIIADLSLRVVDDGNVKV